MIEGAVFEYWQAVTGPHDRELMELCLDRIRPTAQQIARAARKTEWDARLERVLKDACLNYSSSRQISFPVFFFLYLDRAVALTEGQRDAAARKAKKLGGDIGRKSRKTQTL